MSRMLRFACVGVAMLGVASVANAQVCAGTPAFSAGSARVGGSALFGDNSNTYGAHAALGARHGLFLTGSYTHAKDANSDGSSNGGGGALGYEYSLGSSHSLQICPMVGVFAQEGSVVGDAPAGAPYNTLDWNFGGTLGWVASSSASMQVIPSVSAAVVARNYKPTIVTLGQPNPSKFNSFGVFSASIGFVFHNRITISPTVRIPSKEDFDGKASYGVAVTYNFNLAKGLHM